MTRDDQGESPPAADPKNSDDTPGVPSTQPAAEPRGGDEIRRELGAGDGDDPPPDEDDEPLRDN